METSPCCNSVACHQITTYFCTCHDSTAVVTCTQFCSDHCVRIEAKVKLNFHRIWIPMENTLVKQGPGLSGYHCPANWMSVHEPTEPYKQRVLMHGHQGWNVRHGLCHIYMIYVYIWVVYSFCLFCCLFIIVTTQFVALYKPCKP